MNDTPTSGPISISMSHHERDATSSRYSFSRSQLIAPLREGKEGLLEIGRAIAVRRRDGRQLVERAFAADAAAAQQHEAIAHARSVADLMDRQQHRPARG